MLYLPNGNGNLIAVGSYLQTLRDGRGYSRADVAGELNTNVGTIMHIEAGTFEPSGATLFALIDVLDADPTELFAIMSNRKLTATAARMHAQAWLARQEPEGDGT